MLPFRVMVMPLFFASMLAPWAWASPSYFLISDIDDTAKITNVLDRKESAWNALFSEATFSGMETLYRWMARESGVPSGSRIAPLVFLSGSPTVLRNHLERTFKEAG